MFESRPFTKEESALRHQSGAMNLLQHPGEAYGITPLSASRYSLQSISAVIAGPDLLSRFNALGGGSLEIMMERADRFGSVHDLASATLHTIELASEWGAGQHNGTFMDPDTVALPDGSRRTGLRGADMLPEQALPTSVSWISKPITLLYGREIERLAWEADDLRRPTGELSGAYKISFHTGHTVAGGAITWDQWRAATDTNDPGRRELLFTSPRPYGNCAQWRIDLQYGPGGVQYPEGRMRTPIILTLGMWIHLEQHRLHFESLASLLSRSEEIITLQPNGWSGTDDLAVVRLKIGMPLIIAPGEAIRARYLVGAGTSSLTYLGLNCDGGMFFEEEG